MALTSEEMSAVEALAKKYGALSYRNRADTTNPAFGFTAEGLHKLLAEIQRQPEEGVVKALAECRDIFPIPSEGHKLESRWLNAMGSPESVPDYLKECVEDLHRQIEDKELELKKLATAFQAQQRELASLRGN